MINKKEALMFYRPVVALALVGTIKEIEVQVQPRVYLSVVEQDEGCHAGFFWENEDGSRMMLAGAYGSDLRFAINELGQELKTGDPLDILSIEKE